MSKYFDMILLPILVPVLLVLLVLAAPFALVGMFVDGLRRPPTWWHEGVFDEDRKKYRQR